MDKTKLKLLQYFVHIIASLKKKIKWGLSQGHSEEHSMPKIIVSWGTSSEKEEED